MNAIAPRLSMIPARPMPAAALKAAAQDRVETREDDGERLKRAFVWGGASAVACGLTAAATGVTAALAGPGAAHLVQIGTAVAAGVVGAVVVGDKLSTKPPGNRFLGALAAGGMIAFAGMLGAGAGASTTPAFATFAASSASAGFGLVYGGYGALIVSR